MPIIKSAKKKMHQDVRRLQNNKIMLEKMKRAIKAASTGDTAKLQSAYKAIDTVAKKKIIHPNKADRLKSRLAKKMVPAKK